MGYTDKTQQSQRMGATSADAFFIRAYGLEELSKLLSAVWGQKGLHFSTSRLMRLWGQTASGQRWPCYYPFFSLTFTQTDT